MGTRYAKNPEDVRELAPITLDILKFLCKKNTANAVFNLLVKKYEGVTLKSVRMTIGRLRIKAGLIEIVGDDVKADEQSRRRLYRTTDLGKTRLAMQKNDPVGRGYSRRRLLSPIPAMTPYARANHVPIDEDVRSIIHRPAYVPPKDEPPRARSLDFKNIPSRGTR